MPIYIKTVIIHNTFKCPKLVIIILIHDTFGLSIVLSRALKILNLILLYKIKLWHNTQIFIDIKNRNDEISHNGNILSKGGAFGICPNSKTH